MNDKDPWKRVLIPNRDEILKKKIIRESLEPEMPNSLGSLKVGDIVLTKGNAVCVISKCSNGHDGHKPAYSVIVMFGQAKTAWYYKEEFSAILELNYIDRIFNNKEKWTNE